MRSTPVIVLLQPDDATRITFEVVLKREGWPVLVAGHSDEALAMVRENVPALLLTDMNVARTKSLLRTLRSEGSAVRVVAFDHDGADGVSGADYVLHAPVAPDYLVKFVRQILGRS